MRFTFAVLLTILAGSAFDTARADPYRWCAVMGNSDSIGTNCYFMTLEQCNATVSGNGGFCTHNNFYDGRPVMTPDDGVRASPRRNPRR
jgi:hypothetical protein